jgi:hypothetical protein
VVLVELGEGEWWGQIRFGFEVNVFLVLGDEVIMKVDGMEWRFLGSGVRLGLNVRGMGTVLVAQNLHKWE